MSKIEFEKYTLKNGLRVIVHRDTSTPLACVNVMYDVGSRDEDPERTGFAHLFEHLMFGGSVNIPSYDSPLQLAGGTNNAFTSPDVTNYYLTVPSQNLETGFWLESDRMLSLAFTPKSLEVQRSVVIEEFRQRYLNQPYGDAWLLLRPLVFTKHGYNWATIGKEEKHIEEATMEDVKAFFHKHYRPKNAILVVAGNVESDQVRALAEKYFEPIEKGNKPVRNIPVEPQQTKPRRLEVDRDVPQDSIYMAFHMCKRTDDDYPKFDLLSDVLSLGKSARLYRRLVQEEQLFTELHAYVMGERDPGMFCVSGKLSEGVSLEKAEAAIWEELQKVKSDISSAELEKIRNQAISSQEFGQMSVLNKAMGLAYHELMGDANEINLEVEKYVAVTADEIMNVASESIIPNNCSTLIYHRKKA
ncbi:MAG: zinc protease [Granulosicoccus sp.]|jgi:zinc protease